MASIKSELHTAIRKANASNVRKLAAQMSNMGMYEDLRKAYVYAEALVDQNGHNGEEIVSVLSRYA